jgi:hypothetical protein
MFRAQGVHRENFDPAAVQISTLLSIKTGGCSEDCAYCPQSASYDTGVRAEKLMGTSNNCHRSSGAPNLPSNDSALFSFRFCAVHPKDVRESQLRQLFEVP